MREGWAIKTIKEVTKIVAGGTPKTKIEAYWGGNISWITPADMGKLKTRAVNSTSRTITELGLEKSSAKLFPKNSVVLSSRAPIGHLAINTVPMSTNQGCRGIVPLEDIETLYLFYFLKSNIRLLNELGTGTTFKELSTKALGSVQIPIPPLSEQKQIVAILDEAFAAIDQAKANIEKNIQNAKELFQSKLNEIFSHPSTSSGGDGWEEKTLGEIADFKNGLNFTKSSNGEVIKLVGVADFKNRFSVPIPQLEDIQIEGALSDIYQLRDGDILTVRSNGNPNLIGRCMLAIGVNQKTSHSGFTIRIRPNHQLISPAFLCHFLKSSIARNELINSGTGINIKSLNQGALSKLCIHYPVSIKTQEELSNEISEAEKTITELEKNYSSKLNSIEELKKSILQKAFAGELSASGLSGLEDKQDLKERVNQVILKSGKS